MNRRSFLHSTAAFGLTALWSAQAIGATKKLPRFSDYPFQLGVASGDPSPDGFVIWTRLAPKPIEGGGMDPDSVEVSWQIAEDEAMTNIVKRGKTIANPDWAHSVHVEVSGLRPDRWYWYQFKAGNEVSQKGRARTFPQRNTTPLQLRFAFASCQHYETGYYTAYEHMTRENLDVIVHLGDYIYEGGIGAAAENRPRKHNSKKIFTLDEYRNRYGLYKSDKDLQKAHAAAPWLVTPDDHEVENNYADEISEVRYVTRKDFLKHRAIAYQAYYEHMPLRRSSLPHGPDIQLYRGVPFGRLADFFVLDTRQHRTDQTCGDGTKEPCDEEMNPAGTILGEAQRNWLFKNLRNAPSWKILAQQVMMARIDMRAGPEIAVSHDQWPSYEYERRRVLQYLRDQRIQNTVVLTGDIHSNWANDLIANFDQLDSEVVAAEFVGTSISSGGNGNKNEARMKALKTENPFMHYHNAERGYVTCHVTPDQWRTDYRMVDYVNRPGSSIGTRASFIVENGHPGLQKT